MVEAVQILTIKVNDLFLNAENCALSLHTR